MMSGRRHGVLASKTRKAVVCILFLSSCLYALLWVLRFRHATSAVWRKYTFCLFIVVFLEGEGEIHNHLYNSLQKEWFVCVQVVVSHQVP